MPSINNIFEDLFVLEVANNHLGDVKRGQKIISEFSKIVRFNNIKAAIKLQFRDVDRFIHKDFQHRTDIRYIKKTIDTKLNYSDCATLIQAIRDASCITMSTPFDEQSVDTCVDLGIDIIKIASSDINDWVLIEKIATTRKPVIVSTGGTSLKDIDDLVHFFTKREIPFCINHCVSIYPSEKHELELNQIDFLKNRYPHLIIGFSTHEHNEDIESTMLIAYAKGARTFERHVDINDDGIQVSAYNSLPADFDRWIKAYKKAQMICGGSPSQKRIPPQKEIEYLDALVRGVYAKRNLKAGETLTEKDIYLAIPLQKGQISCRELMNGEILLHDIAADDPIYIDSIDSVYAHDATLKHKIYNRGL
ncbi:N-acetylneuraminate synthase [Brevinema andersonii]|uniref:N-acetylneuraminate synthase n=1 Tax=Brevinema andersonii TaxID=34097 RepID=A0A1I1EDQ7_BREAD|nr:N-acetylneuraminate synthase family protein [Brevinema andersonii]SFB85251.1 N-acetylneuraminate synthase [Brevinema andersonii]